MIYQKAYYLLKLSLMVSAMLFVLSPLAVAQTSHPLDCVYRAEVDTNNIKRLDQARLGLSGSTRYRVWAEFDITNLAGKTVKTVGFRVFNSWVGTYISSLRYSSARPTTSSGETLASEHVFANLYSGFNWTINSDNAWTPATGFFTPTSTDWATWSRQNGKTIIQDLQDHIDSITDPNIPEQQKKYWFAVEFDCFNCSQRPNLRFQSPNETDPTSIKMNVEVTDPPTKEQNLGKTDGPKGTDPGNGEPINMATGNEYHKVTDLALLGPGLPMQYTRHYNSQSEENGPLGYGWTATFSDMITVEIDRIIHRGADGKSTHYIDDGSGKFVSETDHIRVIEAVTDGHELTEPDGRVLLFNTAGRLVQVTDLNGNTQTLVYDADKLSYVEDNFGRRFDFVYDIVTGRLTTMTTPVGQFDYEVDVNENLIRVTHPDTTFKRYHYTDPNDAHNLTEIINEENIQFITVTYDDQDRATSVEYPGGMYRIQANYPESGPHTATDSLGETTTFNMHVAHGIARVGSTSGTGCGTCATTLGSGYDLDDRLQIQEATDPEGNHTTYTYDDRGNILTMTEAAGTSDERTTTYTYHPDYNKITSIVRGSTTVTLTYDANGNLENKTEQSGSVSRTTSYDYNSFGQITEINGPRTDVSDITTFTYYPNTTGQALNRGMLRDITDALGHKTYFRQYNGYGKPRESEDANGVVTAYVYDNAGRLTSKTTAGNTTTFSYDDVGNMTGLHLPGGIDIAYTYTDANLLEQIEDTAGNYIKYVYDTEGNKTREETRNSSNTLRRYMDFEFDDFNRLEKALYPGGHFETRSYDDNGNLTGITDPNSNATSYGYDNLNRLTTMTEPGSRVTGYDYDVHDVLTQVTDPESNATDYTNDGLGRRTQTVSPDTGTTIYGYDKSDNLISRTDANGIAVTYQYDALNRPTHIQFPNASENITYGYDSGTNGIGRLTAMTDPAGNTDYTYNQMGQITQEARVIDGEAYATIYTYDASLNLETITYPGGLVVTYTRDTSGRITGTDADGQPITSAAAYRPFGPTTAMTLGDSLLTISRDYDQRYQLTHHTAGSILDQEYTHDPAGNILSISGVTDTAPLGGTTNYTHQGNRLDAATGQEPASYSYDSNGNIISDGTRTFIYNQNNRLIRVEQEGVTLGEYAYDGLGRRVKKTVSGTTTHYHYDQEGNLIAETGPDGTPLRDIIYQNGERIAMKIYGTQAGTYYFINDHLGTPRIIIDESGQIVWQAAYLPFGKAQVLTETVVNNFRLPGQYYDSETGLHYNWHRYYDPSTGRYLAPDPIGLDGGINLFAYVLNNPVNLVDPDGFQASQWNLVNAYTALHGAKPTLPRPMGPAQRASLGLALSDLGKMIVDQTTQMVAVKLAKNYIGPTAGSVLKRINFFLGVLDPFPPPAGSSEDMFHGVVVPTPPPNLPWENDSPCK